MTKKKARKKVRYRTVTIKLTSRQKKSLDNFCRSRRTTPVKVIKRAIKPFTENFASSDPTPFPLPNQLTLFEAAE